jgi:hypothetical protein
MLAGMSSPAILSLGQATKIENDKGHAGVDNSKEKGCVKIIVQSQSMMAVVTPYPVYNGSRATRKLSMRSSKIS